MLKRFNKKFMPILLTLVMVVGLMPAMTITANAATNATFDFEDDTTPVADDTGATAASEVTQLHTESGETISIALTGGKFVIGRETVLLVDWPTVFNGNIAAFDAFGQYNSTRVRVSLESGSTFNLNTFDILDNYNLSHSGESIMLVSESGATYDVGDQIDYISDNGVAAIDVSGLSGFENIKYFDFYANGLDMQLALDNIVLTNITAPVTNTAPTASAVSITGTAQVGQTLTGNYTYSDTENDTEGASLYKWYSYTDTSGSGETLLGTNATYTLTDSELGKYIRFEVTPVASAGTLTGTAVKSAYTGEVVTNKIAQTALTYNDVTKTYGDAAFTPVYSGGSGSGAVTYSSSDTSVATIDASTGEVTIKKFGTTTLTVTKAGDATYTIASKSCTLTVGKAQLTATVGDYSKTYGEANPSFTVNVSGFAYGETTGTAAGYTTPTASCTADATTDAGTAGISISGGAATNYTFNIADTGTLTINPKTLTPTASANAKEYDGTTSASGIVNLSGIINGDSVTASGIFIFADEDAAPGKTVNVTGIALSGTDKDNYILSTTSTTATANINTKSVSIASVTISDKVYDGTTGATISSVSLSGKIGTEDVFVDYSGATATFANAAVGSGKIVNVNGLALAGADKDNYTLSSGSYTANGNIVNAGTVLAPISDLATGEVTPGASVTLSCETSGAAIYYTTDGSTPSTGSTLYTGALTINDPVTIKAIAVKTGMNDSAVMSVDYTMADTVTAHNSTELGTYLSSTYVTTINLVSGTTYNYDGTAVTRELTINGNGATINVGAGIDGTIVKMTSGAVPDATGKVFFEIGTGGNLTMNNVTLHDASTRILSVYNVKTGGTLYLNGVVFDGFFANLSTDPYPGSSNIPGSYNNFGVHAEPGAASTTVTNCTFGSSNSFRNAVSISGGTAMITNNTFVGTADHDRQNQTDGNEYAVYLYGGTSTVTGNNMSGYDCRRALNYMSAAISIAPYYQTTATITGNNIHDNMCGINLSGSWHTLSFPAVAIVNGTSLSSSVNAFVIGETLAAQNTLSQNAEGGVQLNLDQNDYYVHISNLKEYGTTAYYGGFLSLSSKTSSSADLSFSSADTAQSLIANQKSFIIQVSEDNGANWATASTTGTLNTSSTGVTVTLSSGKTYLMRAVLTVASKTRPNGSHSDVDADIVCYSNTISVTITAAASSSSSGKNDSTTGSGSTNVEVNGESYNAGNTNVTTNSSGQTQTTVTVDATKLNDILDKKGNGSTVTIPVTNGSNVATGVLTGDMVKTMENKSATLEIQTGTASYSLPASEIDIDAVSAALGTNVSLKDITVNISIAEPSSATVTVVANAAQESGFVIMVPAVNFTITCTYNGQTTNVSSFNSYVQRAVAIPDGVDPSKITTGIVVDPDGTTHHVPTKVTLKDGKYYAVINSLTNSTYTVVWHPIEFADMSNHWAKEAVNNMGSRMVVMGEESGNYNPNKDITRAEFAAIIVRALGLAPGTGKNSFTDVEATKWYSGYIETASTYGIIQGYNGIVFGPNNKITREQAMTMIARAMKITGLDSGLKDSEISSLLVNYSDNTAASGYAKTSIAACLKTGIITGRGSNTIAPKSNITRGEVAVIVQRLLQKSDLI